MTIRDEPFSNYIDHASICLMDFQLMEDVLRSIVAKMYVMADANMPKGMCYRWEPKTLAKDSLGKLIDRLEQVYSADDALIDDLRKVVPERNKLAHCALSKYLGKPTKTATLLAEAEAFEALHHKMEPSFRKLFEILGKLEKGKP